MGYVEDLRGLVGHRPVILCGSCGVLVAPDGRILLQQRNEPAARWGLIGGLMELGESSEQVLIREAQEECGLVLEAQALRLLGVYSGDHLSVAPNGDQFYAVSVAYVVAGVVAKPRVADGESLRLAWFEPTALPANMVPRYAQVVADYLERR
ncbi:NUDIX hydrolase [Lacticaseibacillus parakribbianus]|uniref:NUDIX hydrolase n=1 Tax=Lacticaseibacillus parakribbianus TaxID=2970927 RepID=UPI0021CB8D8C|nr:NUDIX domain-containing protein [Lacticaseibacillus parakribbianus]